MADCPSDSDELPVQPGLEVKCNYARGGDGDVIKASDHGRACGLSA